MTDHEQHSPRDLPEHSGLRTLLERLDSVTEESQPSNPKLSRAWRARCPAHEDRNPSLSVCLWDSGRITVKCWADCAIADVLEAVDISDTQLLKSSKARSRRLTAYAYHDEEERLIYRVVRFEPKTFRMEKPDGKGGWTGNVHGVRRVLFRLPSLQKAIALEKPIFVCEGEKDVLRLESHGLYATCNPNGAGNWRPEYSEMLRDAHVVLLPDNDAPGIAHMNTVATSLNGTVASIKVVTLSGLPEKGDVSDWLDAGHPIDELICLAEDTPVVVPAAPVEPDNPDDVDRARYGENAQGLWRRLANGDLARIANFTARITRETVEDDGAELNVTLEITATLNGVSRTFTLTPNEFSEMNWHVQKVGAGAAIIPGVLPHHVRYAIQLFSNHETSLVYRHTGWREIEPGVWGYLHAGGAIGKDGPIPNVRVHVGKVLEPFLLPDPPSGDEVRQAIDASLGLLRLAPSRVMVPLLGGVWRAPLGPVDLSLQLAGTTGVGKTEIAVRLQQHFGLGFHSRRLVGSWSSTANALEGLLFHTKDVMVVIDDFAPRGSENSVRQLHQQADRLFRAQGNSSGRARMNSDTSLRPSKPPRGLVLSTGEDVATGRSAMARTLVVDLNKGDVNWEEMTKAQAAGGEGLYAKTLSAYVQYLAQHYGEIEESRSLAITELREWAVARNQHPRTPEIIANLLLGWRWFLRFAQSVNALSESEASETEALVWGALVEVADLQQVFQAQEDQGRLFLGLLASALDSGAAHLESLGGGRPVGWQRLGWQCVEQERAEFYRPQGPRIGFIDGDDVYLIPDAAYKCAQDMARGSQHSLSISARMLHKNMYEEGLLKSKEVRGGKTYYAIRKQIGRTRVPLLHISAQSFGLMVEDHTNEAEM